MTAKEAKQVWEQEKKKVNYNLVLKEQGGVCFICLAPPKNIRLARDHNHKTGMFRGLLCWRCNKGLEIFRDDVFRFRRAIEYLIRGNKNGQRNKKS